MEALCTQVNEKLASLGCVYASDLMARHRRLAHANTLPL